MEWPKREACIEKRVDQRCKNCRPAMKATRHPTSAKERTRRELEQLTSAGGRILAPQRRLYLMSYRRAT